METRDLRYFLTVAETGSLQGAADRIGRTQPALSKCIRRLEAELGGRLFARMGRNIELTVLGQALVSRARAICSSVDDTAREMLALSQGRTGHLRIGTGPTIANNLLPDMFCCLSAEAPSLTFQVVVGMTDMLRGALRSGEIDLAVSPLSRDDEEEFVCHPIENDDVVVAAAEGHPLARGSARLNQLNRYEWLLPSEAVSTTKWLKMRLEELRLPKPRVKVEVNTILMLRKIVDRSDLLTFVSRSDLTSGTGIDLKEIPFPELTMRRQMGALSRRDRPLPPAGERLIAAFKTLVQDRGSGGISKSPKLQAAS